MLAGDIDEVENRSAPCVTIVGDKDSAVEDQLKRFNVHTLSRLQISYEGCKNRKEWLETHTVDNLLRLLESETVQVNSCLSPCNTKNQPFYGRYIHENTLMVKTKEFILPLVDGRHYTGYIVSKKQEFTKVINMDATRSDDPEDELSHDIVSMLCPGSNVVYSNLYTTPIPNDSHSCGIWLVAAFTSYIQNKPPPKNTKEAFDIVWQQINYYCNQLLTLKGNYKIIIYRSNFINAYNFMEIVRSLVYCKLLIFQK